MPLPRLPSVALSERVRIRLLGAAITVVLAAALVALGSLPTGSRTLDGVVPAGARVAGRVPIGDAQVLLLSESGRRLAVLVAYRDAKGWFGVRVDSPPRNAVVAWASTAGATARHVPALSVVYGRTGAAQVRVRWRDGREGSVRPGSDGTFVLARAGQYRSSSVELQGADGATISSVSGP
jgi:hypothetical protein